MTTRGALLRTVPLARHTEPYVNRLSCYGTPLIFGDRLRSYNEP